MLSPCCINALQHGFALKTVHIGCGDCGSEWTRAEVTSYTWTDAAGTEATFGVDELPAIEPNPCCVEMLNHADLETMILPCRCGVRWVRAEPGSSRWRAYKEAS